MLKTGLGMVTLVTILIAVVFMTTAWAKKGGVPANAAGNHKYEKHYELNDKASGYQFKNGPPPWAPAHGYRAKYRYRYYTVQKVYFCPDRRLWFWLNSGKWTFGMALPTNLRVNDANGFVLLEMSTEKPYQYHSDVEGAFPPGWQGN